MLVSQISNLVITSTLLTLNIENCVCFHGQFSQRGVSPFATTTSRQSKRADKLAISRTTTTIYNEAGEGSEKILSEEDKKKEEAVGNLVANDEWAGIGLELTELIRTSIVEDLKKNTREFIDKDEYQVGDISKEVDARVKDEIANFRGKSDYELGDFIFAMDEMSKKITEDFTGKPYEAGDLSNEIDTRIKQKVSEFCGKDADASNYELGDLSKEMDRRIKERVAEYTGKPYEFGDIANEIENKRQQWVKDYLGEEAAKNYAFGDITKKAITQFTGKDDYEFGDLSKKVFGDLFGKKKK